MRDESRDGARFGMPECAEVEVRDALPALEHGRLADVERRRVERHVAACAACAAELALLRDVRTLTAAGAPALDLDRIAVAVRRATVPGDVVSLAAHREARARRSRFASFGALRAAAAVLLVAVGGAVVVSRTGTDRLRVATADSLRVAGAAVSALPAEPTTGEHLDDLSDAEMSAVLVTLDHEDAALPALEPTVLPAEFRGGGE